MAKKKKNNKRKVQTKKVEVEESEKFNLQDKLFVVFCIVMFFVAFYVLTLYITNKHTDSSSSDTTTTESNTSYQEIILGRSFSMSEKEYYVIYYDSSDEEISSTCSEIVTNYRSNHETKLYFVDMHSAFNSQYVSEESNPDATSAEELLINGPTVIKVVDKAIAEYVEGIDSIQKVLS